MALAVCLNIRLLKVLFVPPSPGELGQQDPGTHHPATAGAIAQLPVPCPEAHLRPPGCRLLPALPPVFPLPLAPGGLPLGTCMHVCVE